MSGHVVTYGAWELAEDVAPILHEAAFGAVVVRWAYRRPVYETWRENGEKFGRWHWEYA